MTIQLLSSDVVSQIAAGEVIERPANVVKELLENSLDAGSRRVQVSLRQGGLERILVEDDGAGIPGQDLPLAFQRHATSKIRELDQLGRIATLGFRGEALYSIAAISHVTLTSRSAAAAHAHRVRVECGREQALETLGRAPGTTISVDQLFINAPVRRRFLKSPAAEAGRVARIVQRMALARSDVAFGYLHNDRSMLQSNGRGDVRELLYDLHGAELARGLLELRADFQEGRISGFVGAPGTHFANRVHIDCFVNGRWIQDRSLAQAVVQGFQGRLPIGRFPFALIFLHLDPASVDFNVHPQKTEVRFTAGRRLFGVLRRSVENALAREQDIPDAGVLAQSGSDLLAQGLNRSLQHQGALPLSEPQVAFSGGPHTRLPGGRPELQPSGEGELPTLNIIGQVGTMYIVAESPTGLVLIDQHAAHERVLYEGWLHRARAGSEQIAGQQLLTPLTLHAGQDLAGMVAQRLGMLRQLGFDIEEFGSESFMVRSMPGFLAHRPPDGVLQDLLHAFERNRNLGMEELEGRLVKHICKRSAIKAGQTLSLDEMETLLLQLGACEAPLTCPHGRPTLIQFSSSSLEKAFGRA